MTGLLYWLDLAGVTVFALSGVIVALRSRMDPFGMLVLAAVTGIGGGTLRDLVLGDTPVFWVADTTYLWVVVATVVLASIGFRYIHRLTRTFLPVTDAFGLALFTVIGAHRALELGSPAIVAVLMGLLTGVAGGVLRDVLADRVPMVLREEVYATAAIAGGVTFVGLDALGVGFTATVAASLAVTLCLRLAAIRWRLTLPVFAWVDAPRAGMDRHADEAAGRPAATRAKLLRRGRSPRRWPAPGSRFRGG